jgi:DNA-binding beta-propeller fold protein YncE
MLGAMRGYGIISVLLVVAVACGGSSADPDASATDDANPDPGDASGGASDAAIDAGGGAQGAVSTLAGTEEAGHQDGPNSRFDNPVHVAVDPASGDVFVADHGNNAIRRVRPDGFVTTVVTETGGTFVDPVGLAFHSGTLYAHTDGGELAGLWRIDIEDGGGERIADVGEVHGLASHPSEGLILPDRAQHVIALFDPGTLTPAPLAGSAGDAGYVDGTGDAARFDEPMAAVALSGGDILVADAGNHVIRRITLSGEVTTFAGTGEPGTVDGPVDEARFNRPVGLALDAAGTIYVACADGHVIRAIADGEVRTVAGSGTAGFADSEDDPLAAQFFGLGGIAAAPDTGILYAADGDRGAGEPYHRIRRIEAN